MNPLAPIYGFHGCDRAAAEKIIADGSFLPSSKSSEWLGAGVYFWENDPRRALEWAKQRGAKKPCVVGAIINPDACLDLSSREAVRLLKSGYDKLIERSKKSGIPIPKNRGRSDDKDEKNRMLDCAVVNAIFDELPKGALSAVKSPFFEGDPVYPGAFFFNQTHVQICVKNPDCLMGIFNVPDIEKWEIFRTIPVF